MLVNLQLILVLPLNSTKTNIQRGVTEEITDISIWDLQVFHLAGLHIKFHQIYWVMQQSLADGLTVVFVEQVILQPEFTTLL